MKALQQIGESTGYVAKGVGGNPLWPEGFVGSIAHSRTLVGAAVASTQRLKGLGIDCEEVMEEDVVNDVQATCLLENERNLTLSSNCPVSVATTLLFSAKESFYKCLYPLVGRYFDFADVEIILISSVSIRVRIRNALHACLPAGYELSGQYAFDGNRVLTSFELTARS